VEGPNGKRAVIDDGLITAVCPLGSGHNEVNSLAPRQASALRFVELRDSQEEPPMAWTTPTLVEICIGLEINGYLPAEF